MPQEKSATERANAMMPSGYVAEWKGQGLHISTTTPGGTPYEYIGQFRSVAALASFMAAVKTE